MPEEIQEVKPSVEPSTTEQEVVNETADTTQQEETTESTETQETQTPPEGGQPQTEPVDEFGVPWKNRAYEWKRKQEDLADKLPTLIKDAVSQSMGQQQTQQYSIEQLEAFATQTENPAYQTWAKGEIRKLEKDDQAKVVRGELQKWQQQRQAEDIAKQSYDYVKKTYSDAFHKDVNGNVSDKWNNSHPLTQMISQLMNNPEMKNRPDALMIASDIAYGRYARIHGATSQQKNQQLKREVKNLQKRTLVEGGSRETSAVPAHRAAIDKLKQSGSMKDAQAAITAVLKRASEE